jgi:hypothetical protein
MEEEINEILSRSQRLLEPHEVIKLSGELETILTAMASWGEKLQIKTLGMARDKVVALGPNFDLGRHQEAREGAMTSEEWWEGWCESRPEYGAEKELPLVKAAWREAQKEMRSRASSRMDHYYGRDARDRVLSLSLEGDDLCGELDELEAILEGKDG